MKNLLFIMTAWSMMVVIGCEKEESAVVTAGDTEQEIVSRSPNFVQLCHYKPETNTYELRSVPANALQAHLNHGDLLLDADGDGYTSVLACTGSRDDCDDNNASFHPGAVEICNFGYDEDCDGLIDDADPDITGQLYWHPDVDGDGAGDAVYFTHSCYLPDGYVANAWDCDDSDPTTYLGATDIPNDGIDQDCSGTDSIQLSCDCFSMQDLQNLYTYEPWPFGWFSDVPGSCKDAPYDQLLELWLTNVGQPSQNFNFSAQAGTINGLPFRSHAKFNHQTGQFTVLCGGYTTAEIAEPCRQILDLFFDQLRNTHPMWDYCVRFP